uniref:Metalloendopeptidase n=1 Tax=Stomoxys calcitrans TaxID=35570 RepID=A0A1I8QC97_STOCA
MSFDLRFVFSSFCLTILLGAAMASPLPAVFVDAEEAAGQFEGDMVLNEEQLSVLQGNADIQGRNGIISETRRWPNNVVHYKLVGDFDAAHRNAILDGIATLEARTCVRFSEADDSETNYVEITSESGGCFSSVGYRGNVQQMNLEVYPLGQGCFRTGTILHEFMHVLGFYHQQSDSNRDNYIRVIEENIVPGKEFNFDKYHYTYITDFDVGYDYDSCLHYRPDAFSVNGEDTIVPFDEKANIGQRVTLSEKDVAKINIMYKCPIQV